MIDGIIVIFKTKNSMNKLILPLILIICLYTTDVKSKHVSTNFKENPGFVITVKNLESGNTYIYLSRRPSREFVNIDSALVKDQETISFSGKIVAPEIMYLRLENSDKPIPFFAENSNIVILPDFEVPENSKVTGSSVHDEYMNYKNLFTDINKEKDELYSDYMKARSAGDKEKMESLVEKFNLMSEKENELNRSFVDENSDSWVTPYVIRRSLFYSLSLDELKNIVESLDTKLAKSLYVNQLNDHIAVLEKVAIGEKFQDFELLTPEDELLALSELVGENYILIDFWASWCGPCRRENPNVVAMYEKFNDQGFEIIGVSLDTNKENWTKAIEDDNLQWPQVSDLKGWASSAGKLYGVSSIPHTVLLSPDGTIIDKNLRGDALEKRLEELLAEK